SRRRAAARGRPGADPVDGGPAGDEGRGDRAAHDDAYGPHSAYDGVYDDAYGTAGPYGVHGPYDGPYGVHDGPYGPYGDPYGPGGPASPPDPGGGGPADLPAPGSDRTGDRRREPAGGPRREPAGGRIEDDIARELLAVRALVESTVVKHRDRLTRNSWVAAVETDDEDILAAARDLLGEASGEVDIVLASDTAHTRALYSVLHDWLLAGGAAVRTRVLCAQHTLDRDFVRRHTGDGAALEVRAARVPPLAAVIVDGRAALVCADSAVGRRASTIRDAGVIETLQTLFGGIWRSALAVTERIDFGDRARTAMVRTILEWLRQGVTDEVAARELAVSVRTYRRYVAEIMSLLGANSRFQAGVRAAELGLLPAVPPTPTRR
ncbi:hypothetical protein RKE29_29355, partial [Streptomyces sp. B1866]|uniref:helix-turn-helix transcriptional regulator n=1 Tax=Streptomyces sp. B1866 TaxID=3075431 RepID=UPI002891605F